MLYADPTLVIPMNQINFLQSSLRHLGLLVPWLMNTLLPGSCTLCGGTSQDALCPACRIRYIDWQTLRCTACAIRLPELTNYPLCGSCLAYPPAFDATFAATDYAPPIDQAVQNLKFHARLPLGHAFGRVLSNMPKPLLLPDLIIPVPLSLERLAERGFNQSLEIARTLAYNWNIPIANSVCLRVKHTQTQASLPLHQRRVNMRNAYIVQNSQLIINKRVGVVDDVMTTGHTLNELAQCLKRHGATHVTNFVVARTPLR